MYLNVAGAASLYSQLRGEDVVETLYSMEHSKASGLKFALSAFLGGGAESSAISKESNSKKTSLRAENMIREIVASLGAHGTLHHSIRAALTATDSTSAPAWFDAKHPFSMPFSIDECNRERTVVFHSGYTRHGISIDGEPHIRMPASLNHFPSAYEGQLRISGHEAMLFRSLNGSEHLFSVFGSIFRAGDSYQVNPYAIRY